MRRPWAVHLLMFMISYAMFLGYFHFTAPRHTAMPATMNMQQVVAQVGSELMTPAFKSHAPHAQSPAPAVTSVVATASNGVVRNEVPPIPPAETFVPDYSSPQAHVTSLERAAQFDEFAGNRLNAVASLRQQVASGDTDGSIADALRAATMDEDPAVRNAAQAAYNEVMAMKQAR